MIMPCTRLPPTPPGSARQAGKDFWSSRFTIMKKLINRLDDIVPELLRGYVWQHPQLSLLKETNIVVRADLDAFRRQGKVALVTGGGSGHEPAHAGYVGPGMLTAAVAGNVFASPSTDAVLQAIRAVATPAGVLLIVKNYTGDRLNFGLAAEIAKAEGIAVEMVVVADDVALASHDDHAGRRGIAGTVLVHKVAGAAAEHGLPLATVRARAEAAMAALASMGVALSPCTVPAAGQPNFHLADDAVELGLGIHGERGVAMVAWQPAAALVDQLLDAVLSSPALSRPGPVALLVNNLGATPPMELAIVTGDAMRALEARGYSVARVWSGPCLTALDMAGVSLSVMALDDAALLAALDAPTLAPAWPGPGQVNPQRERVEATAAPRVVAGATAGRRSAALLPAVAAACQALLAAEPRLTQLDQAVGDGDIGRSLSLGAQALLADLAGLGEHDDVTRLQAMAQRVREVVGGTSGPLYAIVLMAAAGALAKTENGLPTADPMLAACQAAVTAVSTLGGARAGDCTMLDALLPALQALADTTGAPATRWHHAAVAAAHGAAATVHMLPRRGRASYLGQRAIGHPDPGAEAVAIWLRAVADALAT